MEEPVHFSSRKNHTVRIVIKGKSQPQNAAKYMLDLIEHGVS